MVESIDKVSQENVEIANLSPSTPADLKTIVNQAQQNQSDAFSQLVQRFQDMAVGYSYSILGDLGLAEDAAQEAFLNAYLALPELQQPAAFPGWFRRIISKQCDRLIRGKQKVIVPIEKAVALIADTADPATVFIQYEARLEVHNAIAALPLHEREIVSLFYISQYSYKEIADFLELPVSTVKSRLYSARKRLKERLTFMIQESLPEQRPSKDNTFANNVEALFQATTVGNIDAVIMLLTQKPTLAQASGPAQNPLWQADAPALHMAVMYGRKDIIDLLLAHGADINERDEKYKFSALHQALDLADFLPAYKALEMPSFLLERGAKPDIFSAFWSSDEEAVKVFVRNDPSLVHTIGPNNLTPLCFVQTVEMAQFLLDRGADMFAHLACRWPYRTPIQGAHGDVFNFLLEKAGVPDDIFLACKRKNSERILAQIGSDSTSVTARTHEHHILGPDLTLLHLAVVYGLEDVTHRLLDLGADVNARAPALDDMTPLHLAIRRGKKQMLASFPDKLEEIPAQGVYRLLTKIPSLLLEYGADIHARDSETKRTPLEWAEANQEDETDRSDVAALLRSLVEKA